MGAIMFGNGLSGISLNVVRMICLVSIPNNDYLGSLVYFILAAILLVFCAFAMWRFLQLEFVKYHITKANEEKDRSHRRLTGQFDENLESINKSLLNKGSGNFQTD